MSKQTNKISSTKPGVVVSADGVVSVDVEKIKVSRQAFKRFKSAGSQKSPATPELATAG